MTTKILVPVDGSDCSLRAVDYLLTHTALFREVPEIHLLHVHAPIPIGRVQSHIGAETLHSYYLEESQMHLDEAQRRLNAAGRVYITHVHVGQPAEVIARQGAELGCDLIIMGSHGRTGIAGMLMGSVASRVLHLAKSPLLLVQ